MRYGARRLPCKSYLACAACKYHITASMPKGFSFHGQCKGQIHMSRRCVRGPPHQGRRGHHTYACVTICMSI